MKLSLAILVLGSVFHFSISPALAQNSGNPVPISTATPVAILPGNPPQSELSPISAEQPVPLATPRPVSTANPAEYNRTNPGAVAGTTPSPTVAPTAAPLLENTPPPPVVAPAATVHPEVLPSSAVPDATVSPAVIPPAPGAANNAVPANGTPELTLDNLNGQILTLEQAITIAIQGASEVLKAENDLHFNGTRLLQAYGQFLPNLIGTGSYNYNTGRTYSTVAVPTYVVGSGTNGGYGLTADLNLFNGLGDFSNLKSSLLKKDASELTLDRAKQEISLDVAQSFLQVILDVKLEAITKKNLQASQERERLLQEQTDVGAKNLSDLFRQQAQTSLDEAALLSAQNKTRTDQIILMRKIRVDVNRTYHFVEPPLKEQNDFQYVHSKEDELVNTAIEHRFDLQASNKTADANHWDIHTQASNYFPKLDLLAGLNSVGHILNDQTVNGVNEVPPSQTSMGTQLGRQIEYSVGITLTWTIFDRFVTAENVSHARLLADDADIDAQDRKLQVQGDVRQAYGDYLTSVQQLKTSKKGYDAAQKAYEVMDGRYEVGSASFLDLITAQSVLVQAESNRAQALINFQLQDRSLEFAIGTLATN